MEADWQARPETTMFAMGSPEWQEVAAVNHFHLWDESPLPCWLQRSVLCPGMLTECISLISSTYSGPAFTVQGQEAHIATFCGPIRQLFNASVVPTL